MKSLKVQSLVNLRDQGFMTANPEYQRGEVWTLDQQKKLIDSIFRGYQLPIIYLDEIHRVVEGRTQDRLEVIDGQQRINAIHRYCKGEFRLYKADDPKARFPAFLQDTHKHPCPWGGKDFDSLPKRFQTELLAKELPVAFIQDAEDNQVRDLFVRLQAGLPLNAQEKRDSLPGEFTDFILKLGGKPQKFGYPGHELFTNLMGLKPRTDRGRTRQLAAQIAILYFERRKNTGAPFSDIKSAQLDDYYYTQLDFDANSSECQRLRQIMDKLCVLLHDWQGPKLLAHNAIHLVLLMDTLLEDYTDTWELAFMSAQEAFSQLHAEASAQNRAGTPHGQWQEAWQEYGAWTRSSTGEGASIDRRHRFYTRKMVEFLGETLVPKDPQRSFNHLERAVIYWRDSGICQKCNSDRKINWQDAQIHHVIPHKDGGPTVPGNGVLVHQQCHPKTEAEVQEFAQILNSQKHPAATHVNAEPAARQ